MRAGVYAVVCHHRRCAAVSEQDDLAAAQLHAVLFQRGGKPKDIGIVANGFTVFKMYGIDRMQIQCTLIHRVKQADYRLFVRNGQIDPQKLLAGECHSLAELFGRHGHCNIVGIHMRSMKKLRMEFRTHRVPERPAK